MLIFREYIYIYNGHDDRGGGTTNKNTSKLSDFACLQGKAADLHDKDGEDQLISTRLQLGEQEV